MSQANKMVLVGIITALISGGGVYLWQTNETLDLPRVSTQEQDINESKAPLDSSTTNEFAGAGKYNCEKSGGSFSGNTCACPLEEGQTQKEMYDKSTGYCQSTIGGPAGDAWFASIGLPYGDYDFYNNIIMNNCTETGGDFIHSCSCPDEKTYDKSTGYCK